MARFQVDPKALDARSEGLLQVRTKSGQLREKLLTSNRALAGLSGYGAFSARLKKCSTRLTGYADSLRSLHTGLDEVVALYLALDALLLQRQSAGNKGGATRNISGVPAFYLGGSAGMLFARYSYRVRFVENLGLYPLLYGLREHYDIAKAWLTSIISGRPVETELGREETRKMLAKVVNRLCQNDYPDYISDEVDLMMKQLKLGTKIVGMDDEVFELYELMCKTTDGQEAFEKMLTDYTANMEILNSLKENSGIGSDSAAGIAIDELMAEYRSQYLAYVRHATDELAKDVAGEAMDLLGGHYKLIDLTLQAVLGGSEPINSIDTVMATSALAAPASQAYQQCVSVLQSGNYTAADVRACEQSFEFCKALYIEEYQAMLDATPKGTMESVYLSTELSKLQNMQFETPQTAQSYSAFEREFHAPLASGSGTGGGFSSQLDSEFSGSSGGGGGGRF